MRMSSVPGLLVGRATTGPTPIPADSSQERELSWEVGECSINGIMPAGGDRGRPLLDTTGAEGDLGLRTMGMSLTVIKPSSVLNWPSALLVYCE